MRLAQDLLERLQRLDLVGNEVPEPRQPSQRPSLPDHLVALDAGPPQRVAREEARPGRRAARRVAAVSRQTVVIVM